MLAEAAPGELGPETAAAEGGSDPPPASACGWTTAVGSSGAAPLPAEGLDLRGVLRRLSAPVACSSAKDQRRGVSSLPRAALSTLGYAFSSLCRSIVGQSCCWFMLTWCQTWWVRTAESARATSAMLFI